MGGNPPCASCKLLRRRCTKDCVFAPFFPPEDPLKFATVHKVFGASNVSKMLQDIPFDQREDAVSSLVYEANARVRDPVFGCVGAISYLQSQVSQLQAQLAAVQAEILRNSRQMQQQEPHPADQPTDLYGSSFLQHDDQTGTLSQLTMHDASSSNVVREPPEQEWDQEFNFEGYVRVD